jgi:hypothetical protein
LSIAKLFDKFKICRVATVINMANRYYHLTMTDKIYPSDAQERFMVRLPDGMRDQIAEAAKANNRSMNAEIVARLVKSFTPSSNLEEALQINTTVLETVLRRVDYLEATLAASIQSADIPTYPPKTQPRGTLAEQKKSPRTLRRRAESNSRWKLEETTELYTKFGAVQYSKNTVLHNALPDRSSACRGPHA